jgi:hypothetical protein
VGITVRIETGRLDSGTSLVTGGIAGKGKQASKNKFYIGFNAM